MDGVTRCGPPPPSDATAIRNTEK